METQMPSAQRPSSGRDSINYYPEKSHSVEERLNSITHAIGAGMSIAALVYLLVMTNINGGTAKAYIHASVYRPSGLA